MSVKLPQIINKSELKVINATQIYGSNFISLTLKKAAEAGSKFFQPTNVG